MRYLLFFLLLLALPLLSVAQDFEAPQSYNFSSPESYEAAEPQIRRAIDYLLTTSTAKWETEKFHSALKYFMAWQKGHPEMDPSFKHYMIKIGQGNPKLLTVFMVGWSDLYLKKDRFRPLEAHQHALKTTLDYYRQNSSHFKQSDALDLALQAQKEDRLKQYLQKKLQG